MAADPDTLLATYLNDHLAGAMVGTELARRTRDSNEGTELGRLLAEITTEIEEDREELRSLIRELGFGEDRFKQAGAWVGEKFGRLKPNGQLTGYSPLSRLIELEGLRLGVEGKLALWRSLRALEARGRRFASIDLERLIARAESQIERIEAARVQVAGEALAPGGESGTRLG